MCLKLSHEDCVYEVIYKMVFYKWGSVKGTYLKKSDSYLHTL